MSVNRGSSKASEYHPWRHAADLGVGIVFTPPDEDAPLGWWDADGRTIYLQHGLTQRQARCVLAHEVEHASNDDRPLLDSILDARRERATDAAAARRLISLERLIEALRWTSHEDELALELWVDRRTVRTRLASLSPKERLTVERALSRP